MSETKTKEEKIEEAIQEVERLIAERKNDAILVDGLMLSYNGLGPISQALKNFPTPTSTISIGCPYSIAKDVSQRLEAGPQRMVVEEYIDTENYYRPHLSYAYRDTKYPNVRIHIIRGYTAEGDLDPVIFVSVKN